MVCFCRHHAVFHLPRVVCLTAFFARKRKPRAEFNALDGGHAEHQRRKRAFHAAEKRIAQAGGKAAYHGFQNAAHAVALPGGSQNSLFHCHTAGVVNHREGFFRHFLHTGGNSFARKIPRARVRHSGAGSKACCNENAFFAQHRRANRARRHQRSRQPPAEMTAAALVGKAAVAHLCGVIGVSGAQKRTRFFVVAAFRICIFNHHRDCRSGGVSFVHARKKLYDIRLFARGGNCAFCPAFFHRGGNFLFINRRSGGNALQHSPYRRAVALAKQRQAQSAANAVCHVFTLPFSPLSALRREPCAADCTKAGYAKASLLSSASSSSNVVFSKR